MKQKDILPRTTSNFSASTARYMIDAFNDQLSFGKYVTNVESIIIDVRQVHERITQVNVYDPVCEWETWRQYINQDDAWARDGQANDKKTARASLNALIAAHKAGTLVLTQVSETETIIKQSRHGTYVIEYAETDFDHTTPSAALQDANY